MMKLTKREKFLLIFMCVALVVYVGIFLLQKPLNEEKSAVEATLAAKQNEVMNVDSTIHTLEKQELAYEELVAEVKAQERIIGAYVEDEDWNNRIIAFLDKNDLEPEDVVIETDDTYMDPEIGVFTFKRFRCTAYGMNDGIIQLYDDMKQEPDLAVLDFAIESPDGLSDEEVAQIGIDVESKVEFTVLMGMTVKEK